MDYQREATEIDAARDRSIEKTTDMYEARVEKIGLLDDQGIVHLYNCREFVSVFPFSAMFDRVGDGVVTKASLLAIAVEMRDTHIEKANAAHAAASKSLYEKSFHHIVSKIAAIDAAETESRKRDEKLAAILAELDKKTDSIGGYSKSITTELASVRILATDTKNFLESAGIGALFMFAILLVLMAIILGILSKASYP